MEDEDTTSKNVSRRDFLKIALGIGGTLSFGGLISCVSDRSDETIYAPDLDESLLTPEELAIYNEIQSYYKAENIMYRPVNDFQKDALSEGEKPDSIDIIEIEVEGSEDDSAIKALRTMALLYGDNLPKIVHKYSISEGLAYGQAIDDGKFFVMGGEWDGLHSFLWRTVHESGHLAHRAKKAFNRKEMLEKELSLTKLVFENGGPIVLFNTEYSHGVTAQDRVGAVLYEHIYDYLPMAHEAGVSVLKEIHTLKRQGVSSTEIEHRLGELIIEKKKKYPDFKLMLDGENILGSFYYLIFQEAAFAAVANIVDYSGPEINEGLYANKNINHVEKFYTIVGGEEVSLSDLQSKIENPNFQVDLPEHKILN